MAITAPTTKNILVVAGDPSGDLHAASLIRELKAKDPELSVTSIGGVRMQEVSTHFIYNLVSVGAVGFAEPFKNFFLWFKLIKLVRRYLEEKRPACVIAVDFYGFNHQVLDLIPEPTERPLPPPDGAWNIGILPGSRKGEIARHLPIFLNAFYRIKESHPKAKAFVFAVPEFPDEHLVPELERVNKYWSKDVEIVREKDYKVRAQLDFAFTCSGTATLENALLGVPMAVAYKMPRFSWEIAKRVANVQYVSLVNILLKKPAVKELLQEKATVELLAQEAFSFLNNPPRIRAARKELTGLRAMLGSHGAAERAAAHILPYLS